MPFRVVARFRGDARFSVDERLKVGRRQHVLVVAFFKDSFDNPLVTRWGFRELI